MHSLENTVAAAASYLEVLGNSRAVLKAVAATAAAVFVGDPPPVERSEVPPFLPSQKFSGKLVYLQYDRFLSLSK